MRTVDLIIKKRDGGALDDAEIRHMIAGCVSGGIPDYQTTAWLMAVFNQGMTFRELATLTVSMVESGEAYDLSSIPGRKVDKHSTGGVGDKVSLSLAPLVAAAGVPVPMLSGRALGHTGGTLDKLESIPGFNVGLEFSDFRAQLERLGVAMIGQSKTIAPADRKLYALRDVTGTVESIPLITASIMSKKVASGTQALVMDVKTGNGAFMSDPEDARRLAETLVAVGREMDMPVVALMTDMNQPLGRAVGNAVETQEAIEMLKGEGPPDYRELVLALSAEMLVLGEKAADLDDARNLLLQCIESGKALERFGQMVEAQGGDRRVVDDPAGVMGIGKGREDALVAEASGYVSGFDTRSIGIASMLLGAGRQTVDDEIDPIVGFRMSKKLGDRVESGETLVSILYRDEHKKEQAKRMLAQAIRIDEQPAEIPGLIKQRIDSTTINGKGA